MDLIAWEDVDVSIDESFVFIVQVNWVKDKTLTKGVSALSCKGVMALLIKTEVITLNVRSTLNEDEVPFMLEYSINFISFLILKVSF
jgi:hypothetical protein